MMENNTSIISVELAQSIFSMGSNESLNSVLENKACLEAIDPNLFV